MMIPIKEARIYWSDNNSKVVVGTIKHPATQDKELNMWMCMNSICQDHKKATESEAIADLFGQLFYLWERDMINLRKSLKEIRKIQGVSKYIDRKHFLA